MRVLFEEVLSEMGWKYCFVSENEIFFQNRVTEEMEKKYGDLYS